MTVAELRARLREKSAALTALKTKALAEGAPAEDRAALRTAMDEIKSIEEQLDMAIEEEAMQAKHSKPADTVIGQAAATVVAQPKQTFGFAQKMSFAAAAMLKAGGNGTNGAEAINILREEGYGQLVDDMTMEAKIAGASVGKAVNTLVSNQGGILVPTPLDGGIVPLLRAQSTFLAAGPTQVQLVNGQFNQPRGSTGATASYVAQGGLKPVSTPTFDAIAMQAKKLAGIVPITNEARKWTVGNLAAYIENDLREALALTMDLNAYLGTGAGASPTGILNKTGVQTVTGTFATATAPTLAELDALATAMILKLTVANIFSNGRWRWLMSYRTAMYLANMRTGNGDKAYLDMDLNRAGGPMWGGTPVIVTNQVPTNGGTGTNETLIALINFADVLYGEEQGVIVKTSDQASLDVDGAGTMVHLWQQNMTAILAESEHDFGLRRALSVVKAAAIKF